MRIETARYLTMQRELDAVIMTNHHVTYQDTKAERLLALFVELAELANETRSFKYWSKKEASPRVTLLDEYADGIHFFFSLALAYDLTLPDEISAAPLNLTLTPLFLEVIRRLTAFYEKPNEVTFVDSLAAYLALGKALYFTADDIRGAYAIKMVVNYNRQKNDY